MAYIRNQERMVYQTMYDYLNTQLTALNWMSTSVSSLPFDASSPVVMLETLPDVQATIAANTIAVSESVIPDDKDGEMGANGGGLWLTDHVFFVDILGENRGVSKAIAGDVRAILGGRLTGTSRYQLMKDYSQFPAANSDHVLYVEDIEIAHPENQPYKQYWVTVKVTVQHQFTGALNG